MPPAPYRSQSAASHISQSPQAAGPGYYSQSHPQNSAGGHYQQQQQGQYYQYTPTTPGFRAPPPPPPGPPPGADPQLWQWFQTVDADRSGSISASELREALVNGDWSTFDLDTVKMLMGIFDGDRSGTIDFNEFAGLWKYIKDWQAVFRHFDADRSGFIDGTELRRALANFGYNLSPIVLNLIEQKYAAPPDEQGRMGGITFDRFVRACIVIKTATEAFQGKDSDNDGWVRINYDTFLTMIFSLP